MIPVRLLHLAPILGTVIVIPVLVPILVSVFPIAIPVASAFFQGRVGVGGSDWVGHGDLRGQGKNGSKDENGGLHDGSLEGIVIVEYLLYLELILSEGC